MNNIFDQAFQYLLKDEGQTFTNRATDLGGPTKYGITLKTLQNWLGRVAQVTDIENLSDVIAKQIYFQNYWTPLSCDKLVSPAIAICLFDTGVLYGVGSTSMIAQKAANNCHAQLKIDGLLGPESVEALNALNQKDFISAFHSLILARIDAVISAQPIEEEYRSGWTNRANRLLALADLSQEINTGEIV